MIIHDKDMEQVGSLEDDLIVVFRSKESGQDAADDDRNDEGDGNSSGGKNIYIIMPRESNVSEMINQMKMRYDITEQ
jgi:hypothetical protein